MMPAARAAGSGQPSSPRRMAFLMVPNGAHMPEWTPDTVGDDFNFKKILEPLAPHKKDVLVLSGLAQDLAASLGDGGGDHARSAACFLTGVHPRKTSGVDIRVGVSVDQIASRSLGLDTRFPSLELGIDRGGNAGSCDSGYSCAYSANMSWRTDATPSSKEIDPRLVFERLFAAGACCENAESAEKRRRYKQSILDFVADDAGRLRKRLGGNDRHKLDEYTSGVREIEQRLQRFNERPVDCPADFAKPDGIPSDYQEHVRLMCDMMVLAFQGDLTRVATFMFANESSNRTYPWIGVPEAHHELSHHGNIREKQEKIAKINRFHIEQFAYLVKRLDEIKEGEHSLLHQSMIVYGSGISDGNKHNHYDLPIVMAGHGGGSIRPGRHLRYPEHTPLSNLYLSLLDRGGANVTRFGDSTGRLANLDS
jgi:hypothetical protein